jgi:hypothetical protein
METFVELLMLEKEDHLYFSLYVILFMSRGKNEYVTPVWKPVHLR